jgi:hypothetical protein
MSNKNQYKNATRFFGIPVPGWDDGIWPELELLKWQMVENLIMAAMRGNVNAVFREGDIRIRKDSDETYSVKLSATGNEPSCQGAVGGAYFDAPSSLVWKGLQDGLAYYLYVKGSENTFQDARDVIAVSSVVRLQTKYATLVAKADLTGDNPSVDRYPPGKVNARDLAQHVLDFDNPHGDKLAQDELLVRNHIAIGDGNDADLEIDVNGKVEHFPASRLASVLKTETFFADFVTGSEGTVIEVNGKVLFANAVRTNPKDKGTGEVMIGFFGNDDRVKSPNQIVVWNSGEAGVAMRAMIVCE